LKILILRPQPGADATADLARNMGMEPLVFPLFTIEPLAWEIPDCAEYDALLLTSANAVRAIASQIGALRTLPVHTVGPATAQAARDAGFMVASCGQADARAALANATAAGHSRLLWLTGADHIALEPPSNGSLDILPVYQSRGVEAGNAMIEAVQDCAVVALHSARAARHFTALTDAAGINPSRITIVALSPAIAHAAGTGWRAVLAAETPEDVALLRLASGFITATPDTDRGSKDQT
jgi:uroporphyrinogen-III synthase